MDSFDSFCSQYFPTRVRDRRRDWRGGLPPAERKRFCRSNSPDFDWPNGRPVQDFIIFASADNPHTVSANQTLTNDRRERHLLIRVRNLMLEPGEKAHFTVFGEQNWNYQRLQPDWDQSTRRPLTTYREYIIVDAEKDWIRNLYMPYKLFCIKPISTQVETASYNGS